MVGDFVVNNVRFLGLQDMIRYKCPVCEHGGAHPKNLPPPLCNLCDYKVTKLPINGRKINMKMTNKVKKAYLFAKKAHKDQKRKYTGESYVVHPLAVAQTVFAVRGDEEMIIAALLHDTVEDTDVTLLDIVNEFGTNVADLVSDLTDVSIPEDGNRKTRKEIDLFHTKRASARAKTIKLADLIDNSKSILKYDPDFTIVYMKEKRRLLDFALKEGNSNLWVLADKIVRNNV